MPWTIPPGGWPPKIGRGAWRGRGEILGGAVLLKKKGRKRKKVGAGFEVVPSPARGGRRPDGVLFAAAKDGPLPALRHAVLHQAPRQELPGVVVDQFLRQRGADALDDPAVELPL